jgi:hypothetical protein
MASENERGRHAPHVPSPKATNRPESIKASEPTPAELDELHAERERLPRFGPAPSRKPTTPPNAVARALDGIAKKKRKQPPKEKPRPEQGRLFTGDGIGGDSA